MFLVGLRYARTLLCVTKSKSVRAQPRPTKACTRLCCSTCPVAET